MTNSGSSLNVSLTSSNSKSKSSDWNKNITYEHVPLFYEEWDDKSSELLISCDEEVQDICRALPDMMLEYVVSLKIHYESPTIKDMTAKISSIKAFMGLKTPTEEIHGGLVPDLHSRYFIADFSYGLAIIQQIARFAKVSTPNIDATMEWYRKISIEKEEFQYSKYGINSLKDFKEFYLQ